jgi:hypothetical protein
VTADESKALVLRLSPQGVRADMTQAVLDSGIRPAAVGEFIRVHEDAAMRCSERMAERLRALASRVETRAD